MFGTPRRTLVPRVLALLAVPCLLASGLAPYGPHSSLAAPTQPTALSPTLSVRAVSPGPNATGVITSTTVLVAFDRPVAPLVGVEQQQLPSPVVSDPPLAGHGQWVTTAIYRYQVGSLRAATVYHLRVAAGLKAIDGTRLQQDYSWSFSTLRPAVLNVSPPDGYGYAVPRPAVTVQFNQPMDHPSAEAAFTLRDGQGRTVAGAFSWPDSVTLRFQPFTPLIRTATYSAAEGATARSAEGPLPMTTPAHWQFAIAPYLRVTGSTPANGAVLGLNDQGSGVEVDFSAPVNETSAIQHVRISPDVPGRYISFGQDDLSLFLYGNLAPSTRYTVIVGAGLRARAGDALTTPYRFSFTTAPLPPTLGFVTGGVATYDAYRPILLSLQGINPGAITYTLYRLDRAGFVGDLNGQYNQSQNLPPSSSRILSFTKLPNAPLNKTVAIQVPLALPGQSTLPPGYYFVQARGSGQAVDSQLLLVTRTGITLKVSRRQVLVWATDLASGQPVAGLPLTVATGQGYARPPRPLGPMLPGATVHPPTIGGQTVVASGRTGADGTMLLNVPGISDQQSLVDMGVVILGGKSGDAIVASSNWSNGVSPYDYGLSAASLQPTLRLALYTDRPIYRPAQVVHARGIVRADHDGTYSLVSGPISVILSDPNGKVVSRRTVTLDRFGAFSADFTLAANATLGNYQLGATKGTYSANASFQVAEYKKPTFSVTVTTPQSTYSLGQYVNADVQVSYYFGGPVAHAKVHWSMLGYDYIFYSPLFADYAFGDYDPAASSIASFGPISPIPPYTSGYTLFQGDATTDAQGKLHLHLPARLPKGKLVQNYTLEANVTDLDNSPVAGNTSVTVYHSAFQIGLSAPAQVIDPGKPQTISVVTVGNDGVTPAAHEAVRVAFYRRTYTNQVKVNPDGSVSQNYVPHDTLIGAQSTVTDAHGKGSVRFTAPTGGEYHLSATGTDRFGNHVESSLELYAGGEKPIDWGFQPQGHIRLVTDKKTYHTGEVAHVLVTAPYPNMPALISIERGHVLSYQVRRLSGMGATIDLPIPASYLPDTYVSVVVERGASAGGAPPVWRMGYARIHVDPKERAIRLSVAAPTARVAPGQTVALHLHAVDEQGKPVQGSFSLGVVDQAALALAGDSGSGADLLDTFYGLRELGVFTSDTLNISPEQLITKQPLRQPLMTRSEALSGGGFAPNVSAPAPSADHAASKAAGGPTISVRQNFADTAYWSPAVITDPQGNATVNVPLPDNLTTWHILSQGISVDSLVGVAVTNLVATKDLVLRPLLPRFFTLGDKAQVGATVNNNTGHSMNISLQLLLTNGAPALAPPAGRLIHLAAGAEQDVTWPITLTALGTATIQVRAFDIAHQTTNDAVQMALPVQENSTPETVATAGDAGAATQEMVQIPTGIEPNEGALTVTLEPTLAAGLRVGADFLANYPYDSSIDLAARAQGYAELGRLPARASVLTARERAALPAQIARQVQQLYQMQHGDGGFGWWIDDPYSDPYITVYILRALTVVRDQGYPVDATVLNNAVAYLESRTQSPAALNAGANYDANLQAEIVYAITRYGRGADVAGLAGQLFTARYLLDRFAQADLAVALSAQHTGAASADAHTLLADLISAAKVSGASAHWEEGSYDWGALDSDIITTANVLDALLTIDPHNPLIPNTVRWIMAARTANAWESTEATSRSLVGLVDYIIHSGELNGNYRYTVHLNGSLWGSGTVNAGNLTQNRVLSRPIGTAAPAGSTQRISIGRDNLPGHGQLHYVVNLQYYRPVNHIHPVSAGVGVTRSYLTSGGNSAALGSTIRVRLTVKAPQDLFYVTLEDPLPAGCESVDTSLKTTSQLAQIKSQSTIPAGTSDLTWYVTHTDLRDNRTVLFLGYLPAGTYQYTYLMHCTTRGTYHTLPTHIQQSYFPEVFGHGAGSFFTVR